MITAITIKKELGELASLKQAQILQGFFKTGPGEYGEEDIFLGIKVPVQRQVVEKYYKDFSLSEITKLLRTKVHEYRLVALLILVAKFNAKNISQADRKKIYDFYLKNTTFINNWDLVDLSTPNIVGVYLLDKPRRILYKLAKSKALWERRIAVLATFTFIRNNDFKDTLRLSKLLLSDKHDLIHKAVGWMLREVGKRDQKILENFLNIHYQTMPRTMLRYAIERFEEKKRKYYMKK